MHLKYLVFISFLILHGKFFYLIFYLFTAAPQSKLLDKKSLRRNRLKSRSYDVQPSWGDDVGGGGEIRNSV